MTNTTYTTRSGKTVTLCKYGYMVHGQTITPEENEEIWKEWLERATLIHHHRLRGLGIITHRNGVDQRREH